MENIEKNARKTVFHDKSIELLFEKNSVIVK